MKEFVDCLINNNKPSVGIEDAVNSIRIAIAAKLLIKKIKSKLKTLLKMLTFITFIFFTLS